MVLTVATGLVLGVADSYVSVIYADTYHEALGHTAWDSADDDRKEWLLRRASTMIDARYTWITPEEFTTVPRPVQIATAELAYSWLTSEGVTVEPAIKAVSVGAIEVQFDTGTASSANALTGVWGFLDMILTGLGTPPALTTTAGAGTVSVITLSRA